MLLGAIADDFTGATDLASMLVRQGMRAVQVFGAPDAAAPTPDADAVVVALKSRTIEPDDAVAQSLAALAWLRAAGAGQVFFKYCSTFDSTPRGNIGPVADALLDALGADFTIACPALPENGRTVCHGHLFVGGVLLSESGMKDHPLTPMTDPNLVRVLGRQTKHGVGLVPYAVVDRGPDALAEAFAALRASGTRHAIVDALSERHLLDIGAACADLPLLTGGSGAAMGLPDNFRRQGRLAWAAAVDALPPVAGPAAVIAGSCSPATLGQVAAMAGRYPAMRIDPLRLRGGRDAATAVVSWALPHLGRGPVLVYASAPPDEVRQAQEAYGRAQAGALVEHALASIARALVEHGVRLLVVAGGETAGAVVQALGVRAIRIGPAIDPGVPWTVSLGEPPLALALKSGNFGAPDFFLKALAERP
jgi:3-dehydrotetronate 4-kinase